MLITWSHSLAGQVRQELYRNGELIAEPAPGLRWYEDGDLGANRRYEYRIALRRDGEIVAAVEAAAATLAHPPGAAGPLEAHETGFSVVILDDLNPPETAYKVTVWNAEWYRNAKHYSEWSTSRCRTFEDLPTGLPFEFEVVARNMDGVTTMPVRKTFDGRERLDLPPSGVDAGSQQAEVANGRGVGQPCRILETVEHYGIESTQALLLLSGFPPGSLDAFMDRPWIADGLDGSERSAIGHLAEIASAYGPTALGIVEMPFLDAVEPADVAALGLLAGLKWKPFSFAALTREPWVRDGLADHERSILRFLGEGRLPDGASILRGANALLREPWVVDGLSEAELSLMGTASWRAGIIPVISALAAEPWVVDGLSEAELSLLRSAPWRVDTIRPISALAVEPWVVDGLSEAELSLLRSAPWRSDAAPIISALAASAWVVDGLSDSERRLLSAVQGRADAVDLLSALVAEPWVDDGLSEAELSLLLAAPWSSDAVPLISALASEPWVDDGLSDAERDLLRSAPWSADAAPLVSALAASAWVVDGLSSAERALLAGTAWLGSHEDPATAAGKMTALFSTPWIRDGLTDDERFILMLVAARLSGDDVELAHEVVRLMTEAEWIQDGLNQSEHWMLERILAGTGVTRALRTIVDSRYRVITEERVIDLPHSGPMPLVIIRGLRGSPRSMDDLEYAVRGTEALVGEPLPTDIVRVLLDPFEGQAFHGPNYISMPARTEGIDWLAGALIHEVGHYYFRGRLGWINEGGAGIIEDIVDLPRTGRAVDANNYPCVEFATIAEFEMGDSYDCSYSFGKRIFADLYRTLGPELFQRGFRNLYLKVSRRTGDSIQGLRAAFREAAPDHAQAVDAIVERWYNGPTPLGVPPSDRQGINRRLVDSDIAIVAAEIVLPDRTAVRVLSTENREGGPFLRLRFRYPRSSEYRDAALSIVGHFEDGFAFYRGTLRFTISPGRTQHSEVIAMNPPAPGYGLAPGQYWVFVYDGDRKVAETSFSVEE